MNLKDKRLWIGIIIILSIVITLSLYLNLNYSNSTYNYCEDTSDCIWLADENCNGCWNKKATHDIVGHGMCSQEMFCVCENNACQYPKKEWIKENFNLSKEKCKETFFSEKCIQEIFEILGVEKISCESDEDCVCCDGSKLNEICISNKYAEELNCMQLNGLDTMCALGECSCIDNNCNYIESYVACGCGCCEGIEPELECLYRSKGDNMGDIIRQDREMWGSPDCDTVGCSTPIKYVYCYE